MKKTLAALTGFVLITTVATAQCPAYYPLNTGDVMEMTNYDKKGKETGKQHSAQHLVQKSQSRLQAKYN